MAYKIEVLEDIPAKESLATPWFDQVGGGVQYRFEDKISKLSKNDQEKGISSKIKLVGAYK